MKEQSLILKDLNIDRTWTLFLDRDGVINHKIERDYVREWKQFRFLPSVEEALSRLARIFGYIIVITNQRGVARNFLRDNELTEIHRKMIESIRKKNGRIDRVYVCPHELHDHCNCRKPRTGLALMAKRDFPSIVFSKSIMVGDDKSDIIFAKALNMKSVLIEDIEYAEKTKVKADFVFESLFDFALSF